METKFCPYLGTGEGHDSHFSYPSTRNRCYRTGAPVEIGLEHQESFCQSDQFINCVVYQDPLARLKTDRGPAFGLTRRTIGIAAVLLISMLIVVFAGLLLTGFIPTGPDSYIAGLVNNITLFDPPPPATEVKVFVSQTAPSDAVDATSQPDGGSNTASAANEPEESQADDTSTIILEDDGSNNQATISDGDSPEQEIVLGSPDAFEVQISGGKGVQLAPVYVLPESDNYKIQMGDQTMTLTRGETAVFTQAGVDYSISIENVLADTSSDETIKVTQNGELIEYQASRDNEISITMVYKERTTIYTFKIRNLDVKADHKLTVTNDLSEGTIVLNNQGVVIDEYDLAIEKRYQDSFDYYLHNQISFRSINSHQLIYADLDDEGSVTLKIIDQAGDLVVETLALANVALFHYLPMLYR